MNFEGTLKIFRNREFWRDIVKNNMKNMKTYDWGVYEEIICGSVEKQYAFPHSHRYDGDFYTPKKKNTGGRKQNLG